MKRFLIAALLLTAAPVSVYASALKPPWIHKAKKAPPVSARRVEYHGTTAYSAEGRLYFPTPGRDATPPASHAKLKFPWIR